METTTTNQCSNGNHTRSKVLIRFCSTCGKVVNEAIELRTCSLASHSARRNKKNRFCVNCGEGLIKPR